jgi:putative membrane protein
MIRTLALLSTLFVSVGTFVEVDASAATGEKPALTNPTQPQILHVLISANKAEIEDGQTALKKASSDKARALAQHMVTDHTASLEKLNALATKMGWKAEDNALSQHMEKEHQEAKTRLASQDGVPYDKAYVELQVKMHKDLLDTIDTRLLPNTSDPSLKAAITEMRPTVAEHLEHAQKLEAEMKGSPGSTTK